MASNAPDGCIAFFMFVAGIAVTWLWYRFIEIFSFDACTNKIKKWLEPHDINKSNRIFGITEDRIVDGKWVTAVTSLWRAKYCDFFIVEVDELTERKITSVTKHQAQVFITKHAEPPLASKLLRDWLYISTKEQSCLGCD